MSTASPAASSPASPPSAPPTAPTGAKSANRTATVALACLGVFVSYLPVVGVSTALAVIQQALNASTVGLQWITDAFILPTAALLLTFGVLGDLHGRKKVYLSGLSLTVLGCLVALTAHGVLQVCVGQALTGVGTAALLPSTIGLISHVCPDPKVRARAIAAWTASLGLGLTLGPLFNGQILNHVGWRWIFLPALILGAVIAVVGAFVLPDSRSDRERHLDIPGQLLAIVGITGVVYGVIEGGGSAGWGSTEVIVAFVLAAVSANSALRQIGSALGPAVFGVILTNRTLGTLPGHLAASGLSQAHQGQVNGMVSSVGIQAGAFLHLSTGQSTGQAVAAYGDSFTDALHTCALVGGISILIAAVISLVLIGVRRTMASETARG